MLAPWECVSGRRQGSDRQVARAGESMVVLKGWSGEAVHGQGWPPVGVFGKDDVSDPSNDLEQSSPGSGAIFPTGSQVLHLL